jgi:hypothetical protein
VGLGQRSGFIVQLDVIIDNLPDIAPEQCEFEANESYFGGVQK